MQVCRGAAEKPGQYAQDRIGFPAMVRVIENQKEWFGGDRSQLVDQAVDHGRPRRLVPVSFPLLQQRQRYAGQVSQLHVESGDQIE